MSVLDYLFGGSDNKETPPETYEERRFRAYIRALNTPVILPPEDYVDPYAVVWEGRGARNGNTRGVKEGYQ